MNKPHTKIRNLNVGTKNLSTKYQKKSSPFHNGKDKQTIVELRTKSAYYKVTKLYHRVFNPS